MRPPIVSVKHYVQTSLTTIVGGAALAITLASVVDNPTAANTVKAGCVLKAVFVEMWVRSTELSPGTVLVSLIKAPDGQTPNFADSIALHAYNNKKNVLYHTQGLTNENSTSAIPFVRQWFKIPKGKQRFGTGDTLFLLISSQAAIDNVICGFTTYKEYT